MYVVKKKLWAENIEASITFSSSEYAHQIVQFENGNSVSGQLRTYLSPNPTSTLTYCNLLD